MADWRDERVRAAEEALHAAVRTADEVLANGAPPPPPEPAEERSVLRDAW
jgi:hypothetical protein